MLTDKEVQTKGPGTWGDKGSGLGLYLIVEENGRRKWGQRVTIAGTKRRTDLGHGNYPQVTLAMARLAAAAAKDLADQGIDPVVTKRRAQAAEKAAKTVQRAAAAIHTLADAADAYVGAHGIVWKTEKARKAFRKRLDDHAPKLMKQECAAISVEDVRAALAKIWTTKPVMAQKVRSHIKHALDFAKAAGWRVGENPAAWDGVLKPLLAKPALVHRERHNPALPWTRVSDFLAALRRLGGNAALALRFAILTAARSGEVRGMTWGEVDFREKVWRIPAARMKAGKDHRVPLSEEALSVLEAVRPAKPAPDAVVFHNRKGTAFSDMALLKCVQTLDVSHASEGGWRDEAGVRVTCHGFRSSFRSWCGDHAKPREIAEAALAHALGSETERAYARSDLLERRRALMSAWGAHCVPPRRDGKVVPLRRAAKA